MTTTVAQLYVGARIVLRDFFGTQSIAVVEGIEDDGRWKDMRTLHVRRLGRLSLGSGPRHQAFVLHRSHKVEQP